MTKVKVHNVEVVIHEDFSGSVLVYHDDTPGVENIQRIDVRDIHTVLNAGAHAVQLQEWGLARESYRKAINEKN